MVREEGWSRVRCCTFHPTIPNYLLGRALDRTETGARLVRSRISRAIGVGPLGVEPGAAWLKRYHATPFASDPALRCPFWVDGELSCAIWPDRPARCRAWFCRHEEGELGGLVWLALDHALGAAERALAAAVARQLAGGSRKSWAEWYRTAARVVEDLDPTDVRADLTREREKLRSAIDALEAV